LNEQNQSNAGLLGEVDPTLLQVYNLFLDTATNTTFDPHTDLGFWCALCPRGADCDRRGSTISTVVSKPGFFMGSDGTGTNFFQCLNKACLGGADKNKTCSEGYTGDFCTECVPGLVQAANFQCSKCLNVAVLVVILVVCIMVGVAVMVLLVREIQSSSLTGVQMHALTFKIVASAFQVNATALAFAFNWDEVFQNLLQVQSQATSFGTAYLEFSCFLPNASNPFFSETVLFCIAPLVLVSVPWVVLDLKARCFSRGLGGAAHEEAIRNAKIMAKTSTTVVLFLMQPTLTQRTMLIFSCVKLGKNDDDWYMAETLAVQCWQKNTLFCYFCAGRANVGCVCVWDSTRHFCFAEIQRSFHSGN